MEHLPGALQRGAAANRRSPRVATTGHSPAAASPKQARQKKKPPSTPVAGSGDAALGSPPGSNPPRKRGRPPKNPQPVAAVAEGRDLSLSPPTKRTRPSSNSPAMRGPEKLTGPADAGKPRSPGRPRKMLAIADLTGVSPRLVDNATAAKAEDDGGPKALGMPALPKRPDKPKPEHNGAPTMNALSNPAAALRRHSLDGSNSSHRAPPADQAPLTRQRDADQPDGGANPGPHTLSQNTQSGGTGPPSSAPMRDVPVSSPAVIAAARARGGRSGSPAHQAAGADRSGSQEPADGRSRGIAAGYGAAPLAARGGASMLGPRLRVPVPLLVLQPEQLQEAEGGLLALPLQLSDAISSGAVQVRVLYVRY